MEFLKVILFCLFVFSLGVIIRFELCRMMFSPTSTMEERVGTIITLAAVVVIVAICLIVSFVVNLGMMFGIIPGLFGLIFGESVYYGWERNKKERENQRYQELYGGPLT